MELIVPGILGATGIAAAVVAALAGTATRACLALGLTAACVAALALLHFAAPLSAAAILIAYGGLGIVSGRLAGRHDVATGRTGLAWPVALAVALAVTLVVCLVSTAGGMGGAGEAPPGNGPFLVAAAGLAALAVILGLSAVWRASVGRQDI
jgi:hypothetical protein